MIIVMVTMVMMPMLCEVDADADFSDYNEGCGQ